MEPEFFLALIIIAILVYLVLDADDDRRPGEKFATTTSPPPGAVPPALVQVPAEPPAAAPYPGAIDVSDLAHDRAPGFGHADAMRDRDVPRGNPFLEGRIAVPQGAPPCVDDEATAHFDGDELVTYHARARNDPERVWAGARRRKAHVQRYVGEELDEAENTVWWGRHEV